MSVRGEADGLSYVAQAAFEALMDGHEHQRGECWNLTHGKIVGEVCQTPKRQYWGQAEVQPKDTHDDEFPQRMYDLMVKAKSWVDITSLSPPDGKFAEKFAEALKQLDTNAKADGNFVTVRMLFGNIIGMPVDTDAVTFQLTKHLNDKNGEWPSPDDTNISLTVGAWRKGVSWNHSKIIAVDGKYLHNGGHNLWDQHYLQGDPVHDISEVLEGQVANDGHAFANFMWERIEAADKAICKCDFMPDWVPCVMPGVDKMCVCQWPVDHSDFPDPYEPPTNPLPVKEAIQKGEVPMITIGRYGALHLKAKTANPSDKAITAMLNSAQKIIRMSLQDLGPMTLPFGSNEYPTSIPGGVWPEDYLNALGTAIYERGVDVEIVLSNPHAVPGGLNPLLANYGNGWSCADVASEIIKAIQDQFEVDDAELHKMVDENLRVCFIKSNNNSGGKWSDGNTLGNHAKFFIVDDLCYYMGSQNLYICDLAEWGVIIDQEAQTKKVMQEYWQNLWQQSYTKSDCNVHEVMDGLTIDRNGAKKSEATEEDKINAMKRQTAAYNVPTQAIDPDMTMTDHAEIGKHFGIHQDHVASHYDKRQ